MLISHGLLAKVGVPRAWESWGGVGVAKQGDLVMVPCKCSSRVMASIQEEGEG